MSNNDYMVFKRAWERPGSVSVVQHGAPKSTQKLFGNFAMKIFRAALASSSLLSGSTRPEIVARASAMPCLSADGGYCRSTLA